MNIQNIHEMNIAANILKKGLALFYATKMPNMVVTQTCIFFLLKYKKAQINNLYLYICTHTNKCTHTHTLQLASKQIRILFQVFIYIKYTLKTQNSWSQAPDRIVCCFVDTVIPELRN